MERSPNFTAGDNVSTAIRNGNADSVQTNTIYGSAVLLLRLGSFFSFLILYTVGGTPWTGDQSVARWLPLDRTTRTQNKRTQTSMP
jgi:hypothetical protein